MNPAPLVSVIMNCYNAAAYLAESIDSVYAQTFTDWEIILWDNCSTDDSPAISRRYDGRLRYFRGETNVPLGHARNLAMAQACGEYIAFLDCDDTWVPTKLEKQVRLFRDFPETGIVYSDAEFFSGKSKGMKSFVRKTPPEGMAFRHLLTYFSMPMCTNVFRRSLLAQHGGFDEQFNMVEDADFFLRLAYVVPVKCVNEPLARRRMHQASWTATRKELFPQEEEVMLAKFARLWPSFEKDYADEIAFRRQCIDYQYAVIDWERGDGVAARRRLRPYLRTLKKRWIPSPFSFLPYPFYRFLKHNGKALLSPFVGALDDQAY